MINDKERSKTHRVYRQSVMVTAGGYVKARQYNRDIMQLKPGLKEIKKKLPPGVLPGEVPEGRQAADRDGEKEIAKTSLMRTRDSLIAYASENSRHWHSFITLTFGDEVTEITEANNKFSNFTRQWNRNFPEFRYLGVPEYQKNGRVHYHLLTNLVCGDQIPEKEPIKTYNKNTRKETVLKFYDLPYWGYGFSSAFNIDTTNDQFNVALYITKYLFKDVDNRLFGHNKILKSNNLDKPVVYYLNDNQVYTNAIKYLLENGYQVETYVHESEDEFAAGFTQDTIHMVKTFDQDYLAGYIGINSAFQRDMK